MHEGDASVAVDNDDAYGSKIQNKQNKMADIVSSGTTEELGGERIAGKGEDMIIHIPEHRQELKNFRRRTEQRTSMV